MVLISNKKRRGFTLIETQLAVYVASIILAAALSLYIHYWRSFLIDSTYLDIYSSSRIAMDRMVRDIRCASQVVQQYPVSGTATYQTSDNCIVLQVPSVDNLHTPNVINSISVPVSTSPVPTSLYYDYIIYQSIYNTTSKNYDLHQIVKLDDKFSITSDPYYHKNGRIEGDRVVARYYSANSSNSLTFSSGDVGGVTLSHVSNLSTVNAIGISLPINKIMVSLSGGGTGTAQLNPTAVVRLRSNK